MSFDIDIKLTHKASVAVVSSLWNQEDIIGDINEVLLESNTAKKWIEIEDKVLKCLMTLKLPNCLKLSLQNFIQPMGVQILKWINLCQKTFKTHPYNEKAIQFVWSNPGTLDYAKTAELIIESNLMEKELCFCLACIFCLEDTVHNLWPSVRKRIKKRKVERSFEAFESKAVVFWRFYLEDQIEDLMDMAGVNRDQNAYAEFAVTFGFDNNWISPISCFFNQLDKGRRLKVILLVLFQILYYRTKPREGNSLMFVYSLISDFTIMKETICRSPYPTLSSLLEWPCHKFFISLASILWERITTTDYINLLQDIVEVRSRFHIGDLYKNLFDEFWVSSPDHLKEYTKHECTSGTLLGKLFKFTNIDDILQIFFKDCTPEEKRNMISHSEGMNVCDMLVKEERWDTLKMFVTDCISLENLEEFLEQYQNYKPSSWNKEMESRTVIFNEKVREWYEK